MSDDADDGAHEVGSLADEANKLFGALSGWARENAGAAGGGLSDFAAQAAGSAHDLNDHLATGSAECTVCPICRAVHAVRHLSPEVKAHLTSAAASLAQAATALMETHLPQDESRTPDVERINLDDTSPQNG